MRKALIYPACIHLNPSFLFISKLYSNETVVFKYLPDTYTAKAVLVALDQHLLGKQLDVDLAVLLG